MHKSYKKTVAILITCALISALCCIPVSAVVSGGSTLLVLDSSTRYTPGIIGSESYATVTNSNSFFNAQFSSQYTGKQEINLRFTFTADNNNGYFKLLIKCNDALSSSSYQGIFDSSGNRISFLNYSHTSDGVLITGTGTIPSNFNIVIYYNYSYTGVHTVYLGDFVFEPSNEADRIIANQNANTDKEIQADKENTQAIIDNQNELAEQEKQEITDSGNQATDAMDSIPNESEGFINALGTFVSTMSTTDTHCSITFPAIKTPSFAGIPSATLSEEKEVDFSTAISLIPSDIMKLIQALTTIALIVFCFKELYDTISEALTRKKANSDG